MEKYGERYLVTKKLALIMFVFALAVCVGVGLVVYFLGVEGGPEVAEAEPTREPDSTTAEAKVTKVRLPTHLVPVNYKLELVPFIIPDNFSIRGYAEVSIEQSFLLMTWFYRLRWSVRSQLSILLFMQLILK